MRNDLTARPAIRGPLALMPFAAAFATIFFVFGSVELAHGQDFLAPPPGAITDGEDEEADGASDDMRNQEQGTSADPSTGSLVPPGASAAKVEPQQQNTQKVSAPIAKQATQPASGAGDQANSGEPLVVASQGDEGDIYGQWSANKLKNQQVETTKAHPLALNYPGHFVVVCEAGCRKNVQHIVYLEPRDARGPVYETPAENIQAESNVVACVGGCYGSGGTRIYQSNAAPVAGGSNSWMTTSDAGESSKPTPTGERWYERIKGDGQKVENKATN